MPSHFDGLSMYAFDGELHVHFGGVPLSFSLALLSCQQEDSQRRLCGPWLVSFVPRKGRPGVDEVGKDWHCARQVGNSVRLRESSPSFVCADR